MDERVLDAVQALCNRGRALHEVGRHEDALAAFTRAVMLAPDSPRAHFYRGFMLLLLGRWHEGWGEYAWRARLAGTVRVLPGPVWNGAPLGGRTILLEPEQGLGDTLQMLRYVPLVAARGGRVALAADAPLKRLLEGYPGIARLYGPGDFLEYDVRAPLFALPAIFGTTPDMVPPPLAPKVPRDAPAAGAVRAARSFTVGLVWAGNPRHPNDARRSCRLEELQPLLEVPRGRFFSLQKGAARAEAVFFAGRITELDPALGDFADTAAAIEALDLVVSVDTSVAHLAGTMGKRCWLMLPAACDWRWLLCRADTPWYPSVRLVRQRRAGDWHEVALRMAAALATGAAP